MVFSTALSPFLIGWMLDNQIAVTTIIAMAIVSVVVATTMAFMAQRWMPKSYS
jgi:hypothetical protein